VKRWVKMLVAVAVVAVLIVVGIYIYLYDEKVFKLFTISALASVLGFLWHYGKSGARLGKRGGAIMT